jgi:ATP synthase regulation protein NCA2
VVVIRKLALMHRSGELGSIVSGTYLTFVTTCREHILEPLEQLSQYFMKTIRRRNEIVSRNDFEQSSAALERMLVDYLRANKYEPQEHIGMDVLMRNYEQDIAAPIKNIVFGDLMQAVLIQMQKLKVHTEAAMLTMDQILASNELTIATTAALPAFALIGAIFYFLKNTFRSTSPRRIKVASQRLKVSYKYSCSERFKIF